MKKKEAPGRSISILVTDLDDTLYDWVSLWHASFTAMLNQLLKDTGLPQEQLEADFKAVFTKHQTSEYAFAIQELPSVVAAYPGEDLRKRFSKAIDAFRTARNANLELFPTVRETLLTLKKAGCLIVGYTESQSFHTIRRLKKLRLDGVLDYLYSSPDHDLPAPAEELRLYDQSEYQLHQTVHRQTEKGALKPNPQVLLKIVRELGGEVATSAYVGDKLPKDVGMAQDAGLLDLHASYAVSLDDPKYAQLRRVTHWTAAAVEREKVATPKHIVPAHRLETFGDLLKFIVPKEFVPAREKDDTAIPHILDAWKTTIEVQQHFNDIELRIRNFGLTIVLATIGAAGWTLKERLLISAWGCTVPVGALVLMLGCLGWLVCYVMDRHWYHRLLKGAVDHGCYIEKRMRRVLPELALSISIGRASPFELLGVMFSSNRRVNAFYGAVGFPLAIAAIALLFAAGHVKVEESGSPVAITPASPQAIAPPPTTQVVVPPSTLPTPPSLTVAPATTPPAGPPPTN
jgi:FMN phosphatase YigB (HAD superfamily)